MKNQVFASKGAFTRTLLAAALSAAFATPVLAQETEAELKARIQKLESELIKTKQALSKAKKESVKTAAPATEEKPNTDMVFDVAGGKLKVGGAIRVNYAVGDYATTDAQRRASTNAGNGPALAGETSRAFSDGGSVALDTFRINLDYTNGNVVAKGEYRWYDGYGAYYSGYHFLHTAWVGYNYDNGSQVQVGVNRVPFGPGAYGVSQSWFFDQHYYVGLSDDMDLGAKYSWNSPGWKWDVAAYASDEGNYSGSSQKADRFSYDAVTVGGDGYEEAGQINFRGIHSTKLGGYDADIGFSLQYTNLNGKGINAANVATDDGDMYAISGHMVNKIKGFTLASQLTYYSYDVDDVDGADQIWLGAFSFPTQVAQEAYIPAVSLSYYMPTPSIGWLDYAIPYIEYSSIVKQQSGFNDSQLITMGAALGTAGGWYTYAELALSTGNDFVGGEAGGNRFGSNADDRTQKRFNVNFGYYF